ncbi:FAD-dependent oxidoreductase [Alloiococcus sp. CFN-8]|uniref:bile acid Fe-S flavoenzyme BaiCD n=1 Tax=Alloiococcus sp. CFN-8 TaxID=3416081 RepID=UPI003CE7D181
MKYKNLFEPIILRGLQLKNRVVFPAMGSGFLKNGHVTDSFIDYHVARALGGNGLNITEAAAVHGPSAPRDFLMRICDDECNPGLKRFTDAIHNAGGKACVQLWQGGVAAVSGDPEAMCIVPSDTNLGGMICPGATVETIQEVVEAFGEAAKRAVETGFDCVEYHAAHGYSPHSFLSAAINKRTDEYGGSLENRARYSLECIKEIRKNIPDDMPLLMRIVAQDDYLENGLTIEDIIEFCKMAKKAGVDVLDVSRGNAHSAGIKYEVPAIDIPRSFNVDNAARIKKETGMTTIAVGRINSPEQAEEIISSGKVDMVVMGRAQIADPEFCKKAYSGDEDKIIRCIACNQGCVDRFMAPGNLSLSCLRNPAVGREKEYALKETAEPKKVLIAGGGMAGLEAAITLKQRGHMPTILEESDHLGGQFLLAGLAPRKEEMKEAAISRGAQAQSLGIDININTKVTTSLIEEYNPDAVIISTGGKPAKLNVPGKDLPHVLHSFDVMEEKETAKGNIVVIGGGLVGLEVAEYLSEKDGSNKITVLEMMDAVGKDLGVFRKICVMENLYMKGIQTIVNTKCMEIKETSVIVERDGEVQELPCDYVVIAIGSASNDYEELKSYCEGKKIPYYVIGDALKPRRAIDAIAEAAEIARAI